MLSFAELISFLEFLVEDELPVVSISKLCCTLDQTKCFPFVLVEINTLLSGSYFGCNTALDAMSELYC